MVKTRLMTSKNRLAGTTEPAVPITGAGGDASSRALAHDEPPSDAAPSNDHRTTPPQTAAAVEVVTPPVSSLGSEGLITVSRTGSTSAGRSTHSSRSSASTVRARMLAAEAELRRRQMERDRDRERRQLEQEREVEELELQAKLAAIECGDSHVSISPLSRTESWVRSVNTPIAPAVTQVAPPPQTAAPLRDTVAARDPPHYVQPNESSDFRLLAKSIAELADHAKKHPLPSFSGSYKEWLPFINVYNRTKSQFSPYINVTRLGDALRGAAREAVEVLLQQAGEPDEILRTLEQTYARPELVVTHEMSTLRASPKVSSPEQLNFFANKVRNCVATIKAMKQQQYLYSVELFKNILSKLNDLTKARFSDFAADAQSTQEENVSTLETLSFFLLREADRQLKYAYVPDLTSTASYTGMKTSVNNSKRENVHTTAYENASTKNCKIPECGYCSKQHSIVKCKGFESLNVDDRWRWVREKKFCFRCLKGGSHRWNTCKTKCCDVNGCTRRHHHLLHGGTPAATTHGDSATIQSESAPFPTSTYRTQTESDCSNKVKVSNTLETMCNVTGSTPPSARPCALLKVLPVVVRGTNGECETYALLDEGSTATLIDADVARKIGAEEMYRESIRIDGVGGMTRHTEVGFTKFFIRGRNFTEEYEVKNARSIENLALGSQAVRSVDISNYGHLADLTEYLTYEQATPTVLIGAGDWHLSINREVVCGKPSEPVATRSLLGWTVHGLISSKTQPVEFVNHLSDVDCDSVEALMREQYRLDSIGISKLPLKHCADDQRAIDIVESSVRRLPSGRFEVGLPWSRSCRTASAAPDSYPHALSRLKSLERCLAKDKEFAAAYGTYIHDVLSKGYAEECTPGTYHSDSDKSDNIRWYLPHFGVYHPQKKKLRVVHDAAATTRGISLNSMLLAGPDLLQSLLGILFRFREGKVAVKGDIKEMFPQIRIQESDRDAQRFLWRDDRGVKSGGDISLPVKEFRMSSMIFGAVSSPFIALYIKNKNALEFSNSHPEAAQEIITNHYMDDYIASFNNVDAASRVVAEVHKIHKAGCFEMRSWVSNNTQILSSIPMELWAKSGSDVVLPSEVSALGLKWSPTEDTLGFRTGVFTDSQKKLTKRFILSCVMKVYDPLGLITPIIIKGRILIQDLWREGLAWDDEIPSHYADKWYEWVGEITNLYNFRLPRWYLSIQTKPIDTQLHMFADASEQAYACVAYWRFTYGDGRVQLALIAGKARVTPLKPCTIPRLELQAALIASRLAHTVVEDHRMKPSSITYWTDSTTVLQWLRGDARRYKPFVAHRVGEISENTNPSDWRWLPSELNVADDATRSYINPTLSDRWFAGPPFLLQPQKEWPGEPTTEVAPPPEMKEMVGFLSEDVSQDLPVPDATRFSVWLRLLRTTATVILAARKFRSFLGTPLNQNSKLFQKTPDESNVQITALDMKVAERLLLLKSQVDSFRSEIVAIRQGRQLPKSNRLLSLSPKLEDDLLTIDSRIKMTSNEEDDIKSRILLDDRHSIVRLLIAHYHVKAGHGFNELVFNELRTRLWILRARRAIKTVANSCRECARRKRLPITPPTGDLPQERLQHHVRPFTIVGLDYFGPLIITIGRRHDKRYVALYTCMVTRALHLEIVSSLSTDSAIMSLRRFIARRGCPSKILSDNGTAFVGANRELQQLFGRSVEDFAANNCIQWIKLQKISWLFIPPASPFMGGAWERMVRTVKSALKMTLREKAPKEEEFSTFLLEAECLINSRPLTYVPSSPDAPEAMTPFHFLIGTSSSRSQWLAGELNDDALIQRASWKKVLRLADIFWQRWMKEYLPTLAPRPRSGTPQDIKEGDVVLVADSSLPRGTWPLGRVIKTYPGQDKIVRVVDDDQRWRP